MINEKGTEDTIKMSKNPNVTVRMRGVMEKCTFCIQRVQEAKIATKAKARGSEDIKDIRIPEIFADPSYLFGFVVMLALGAMMIRLPLRGAGRPEDPAPPAAMM